MVFISKIIFSRQIDRKVICTRLYIENAIMKCVQTGRIGIVNEVVRVRRQHDRAKIIPPDPFPPFLPVSPNIKLRIAFRVYNSDISTTVCSASHAFACFFAKSARHYMKWKIDINCCSWHSSSRAPQCSEHRTTRCCGSIRQTFHRFPSYTSHHETPSRQVRSLRFTRHIICI